MKRIPNTHTHTHERRNGYVFRSKKTKIVLRFRLSLSRHKKNILYYYTESYDHLLKLLLIGDAGVGKSSILLRFTDDTFNEHLQSTIGVDFKVKMMKKKSKTVKITIWDTAGQERFRTLTSSYYRGAHGIMLVYDVTRKHTLSQLQQWLDEVEQYCGSNSKEVVKLLVGNQKDMDADREISWQEGAAWARGRGMLFSETSAKTNDGITQVFDEVVQKILENPILLSSTAPGTSTSAVSARDLDDLEDESEGICC